jgi:beta-lactamase regulating signal transducer with metallopeptidase domain
MNFFINFLSDISVLMMVWGCRFLIHSTLIIGLGLLACRMFKHRGAALQSSILRVFFAALILCTLIGNFSTVGLFNFSIPGGASEYSPDSDRFLSADFYGADADSFQINDPLIIPGEINPVSSKDVVVDYAEGHISSLKTEHDAFLSAGSVFSGSEIPRLPVAAGTGILKNSSLNMGNFFKSPVLIFRSATLYYILSCIWIMTAICFAVRLVRAYLRVHQLRSEAFPASMKTIAAGKELAETFGIKCPPVLISPDVQSPILTGILRPAILLPENFPGAQSSQVLAHELAHVLRRDCFWNLASRVVKSLFFFQPLLWILIQRMEEFSEEVCDDYVLYYLSGRNSYARRLVNMAESFGYCSKKQIAAIGVVDLSSSLGHRVERILDDSRMLSMRTGFRALFTMNLFAIIVVFAVSLLAVTPSVLGEESGGRIYKLSNETWSVSIEPSTMKVIAEPKKGGNIAISHPIPGIGEVKKIKKDANLLSWELPEKGATVSMEFKGEELKVNIRAKEPVVFSWPRLRMDDPVKGLIWPHWEGSYIPVNNKRWMERLISWGSVDTLEGLSMPFWGLDCGDYSLTYIITNRYNNAIHFSRENDKLLTEFKHDFPPNHSSREYGFIIQIGENRTPVEPAQKFRKWLKTNGDFMSMKEKMKKTPKVERLLGAPHIYLWGDAYLCRENIRSPKNRWAKIWKPFTRQIVKESNSEKSAVGKQLKKLMNPEQWAEVVEMTETPYDYVYLQRNIANEFFRILTFADFYDKASWEGITIPEEAATLLRRERSSLVKKELLHMNGILLQAAYPEYIMPVDKWGGTLSVAMLKKMKDAGFARLKICLDGNGGVDNRPEVAAEADKMGYLFGIYDSFHSIHDPKYKGTDASWPTAQFNQELYDIGGIVRRNGTIKKGFKGKGYNLSPKAARPYVEARVTENFKNVPYNYYFVDCDAYGQLFDDYTPGRVVTQHEDAMERNDRMKWITEKFDVVMGSEGGSSYSAPAIHIAEGMFLSCFGWGDKDLKDKKSEYYEGGYYPPDEPANFFKASKLKEKYHYFHIDPSFRLPLFEIVFHDSVIATNHWGKDNLKYPDEKDIIFLTQMLYQLPPMYHLSIDTFKKRKAVMKEHYDFFSPLHRELGFSQMTGFCWLTKDRLVQKSVFDDKVEIVANFSDKEFSYKDKNIPSGSVMALWKDSGKTKFYTPVKAEK